MPSPRYLSMKPRWSSDYRAHPLEIGIEEIEVVLGGHVFGKGRKAAHVGEHHGDFLPGLIPQFDLQDAALPQEIQEFLGDKALIDHVQGRELSGALFHALLEDACWRSAAPGFSRPAFS